MADSQGSISYTTDIDTSNTLQAEKVIDKVTAEIVDDFKKVDKQVAKTGTQMKKSSKAVTTGLATMGKNSGQASIQVQQFVGQIQGGQDAMLAFSAQAADLGFVLGFPLLGAVAGISASLAGMLMKALGGAADATENLEEKLRKLVETSTLTEAQSRVLLADEKKQNLERAKSIASIGEEILVREAAIRASDKQLATMDKTSKYYDAFLKGNVKIKAALDKLRAAQELETQAMNESFKTIELLNSVTGDKAVTANKDQKKAIEDLMKTMALRSQMIGKTKEEQFALTVENMKATDAEKKKLMGHFAIIQALEKEQEAIKKTKREEEASQSRGKTFATRVIGSEGSPEQKLKDEHAKLTELKTKYVEDDLLYQQALTSNEEKQRNLRIKNADDEAEAKQRAQTETASIVMSSATQLTDALLATMDKESAGYKAVFAINKAVAIAETIVNAELAAAKVLAHDAGILGLGAVATSNIVRGMGYASAGVIAGTALAGGRQYGGPTTAGSSYRVNETGTPEIYSEGGKDYLMNSGGGKVTPMEQVGGGATNMNVNVENYGNDNVKVERISDRDIKIVIGEITNQMDRNQGAFPRALKSNTNMQSRKGNR